MTSAATDSTRNATKDPKIYPEYCHSLSPTIGKWCPLRATDIYALKEGMVVEGSQIYHYNNHPIKWIRLTGVVVAVDEYAKRRVWTLDDSSGECIECSAVTPPETKSAIGIPVPKHLDQLNAFSASLVKPETKDDKDKTKAPPTNQQPSVQAPQVPWEKMDVGAVVKVKGKIGEYWDMRQIQVIKVEVMHGLDTEVRCWNEIRVFRKDVLGKAWVVSEEEEERCRKVREKELRRAMRGRETEEQRRKRKEKEKEKAESERKRRKVEGEMRPPPKPRVEQTKPETVVKSVPIAVRMAAAGKYDALGI